MDRGELTAAIAAALVGAVLLGWVLRWIYGRLNAASPRDGIRGAEMAARLRAAEEARHRAEQRLTTVEGDLNARLSDREAELAATLASLAKAEAQADQVRAAYRTAMGERDATWQ